LNKIISILVEKTLEQKEIEFTTLGEAYSEIKVGRVKDAVCRTAVMTGSIRFDIRVYLYDNYSPVDIDTRESIKIYGKKTLFEDELELRASINKYNI
jgi:hypothetical protein